MDRLLHTAVVILSIIVAAFLVCAFYASLVQPSPVELCPVTGRITFHGRPQPDLHVEFVPTDGRRGSEGFTDAEGRYEAFYTRDKAGVLVGQHDAIVSIPAVFDAQQHIIASRRQLFSRTIKVQPGTNQFDFDLGDRQQN